MTERQIREDFELAEISIIAFSQDVADAMEGKLKSCDINDMKENIVRAIRAEKKIKSIIVEIANSEAIYSTVDFREFLSESAIDILEKFRNSFFLLCKIN